MRKFFTMQKSDTDLTGLGGWLILVGLGIVGSAAKNAYELLATFVPLVFSGRWGAMITPGAEGYNPQLATFAAFEAAALSVLLALNLWVVYLFFARKGAFPKMFVVLLAFSLAFSLADVAAFAYLLPDQNAFDEATVATLAGGVFALAVWGAYMRASRRVRLTFTR